MVTESLGKHISRQFDADLENLRSRVLSMGGLVEKNFATALRALVDGDMEAAEVAAHADYLVNRMDVSIDDECAQVLARRQPAAIDLRLIMAVIKMTADLERIGDKSEKIARLSIEMASQERNTALKELRYMGDLASAALHSALDAFARMDGETAMSVVRGDDLIDDAYKGLVRQLITYMMEDSKNIRRGIDILWCARALERVGDHAKNISEYVVYMICGKDVRHLSPEQAFEDISKRSDQ